jgi:hypothetical protein
LALQRESGLVGSRSPNISPNIAGSVRSP